MSAKHKLNSAHFTGCVIVAALVGIVTQSFGVFFVALACLLAAAFHAGDIRR